MELQFTKIQYKRSTFRKENRCLVLDILSFRCFLDIQWRCRIYGVFRVHGRYLGWKYKFGCRWESRLFIVGGA